MILQRWAYVCIGVLVATLFFPGCANPGYFHVRDDFVGNDWKTIAVTRFSGDPQFIDVATDVFTLHLLEQKRFNVIEAATVELKATELLLKAGPGTLSILEAQSIGKLVNADAIIIGTVTTHMGGLTMNGFATVRLVDTRSGQVVASSHRPSSLLFAWSVHQCVVVAVERAAKDIVRVLEAIEVPTGAEEGKGMVLRSPS